MNNHSDLKLKRALPFVIRFVKFSTGFSLLIAVALVTLHLASSGIR